MYQNFLLFQLKQLYNSGYLVCQEIQIICMSYIILRGLVFNFEYLYCAEYQRYWVSKNRIIIRWEILSLVTSRYVARNLMLEMTFLCRYFALQQFLKFNIASNWYWEVWILIDKLNIYHRTLWFLFEILSIYAISFKAAKPIEKNMIFDFSIREGGLQRV